VNITPFAAEYPSKDINPVGVDALLCGMVWEAQKAALEGANYAMAISWSAQPAMREIIDQMTLAELLVGWAKMDAKLQKVYYARTTWGITIQPMEIHDVVIPPDLEETMSRQGQAEGERQARIILGKTEQYIASSFTRAAGVYANNPTALHGRAMNMLFCAMKRKGVLVIAPGRVVNTMKPGAYRGWMLRNECENQ
jgi:regulator of protease activity HflC (stomatin/prohibitin superfamily)